MQLLQKNKKKAILLHIYYNKEYSSTNRVTVVFKQNIYKIDIEEK